MIWSARYTKKNVDGSIIREQIGNFACGNGSEVIKRVCAIQGLSPPKCSRHTCRCEFKTLRPDETEEIHTIVVCSLGNMMDARD